MTETTAPKRPRNHTAASTRTLHLLDGGGFPDFDDGTPPYRVIRWEGWEEMAAEVHTAPPSSVVVVHADALPGIDALERLARGTPSVPVVMAAPYGAVTPSALRAMLGAGAATVADADDERTLAALRPELRRVHGRAIKARVEAGLPAWVDGDARTLLRAAAEVAVVGGRRDRLAARFGVNERTLSRWCAEAGLPTPRRLQAWLRVLLALALLEEPRRTVRNVTACSGYSDDSALKRALAQLVGPRTAGGTRAYRARDGHARFADELWLLREARRERRVA